LFRTACILTLCIAASLAAITVAQDSTTEKTEKKSTVPGLTTVQERVSYGIGLNIGRQFKRQNLDIDPSVLVQGIVDVLNDREPKLTPEELEEAFAALNELMEKKEAAAKTENLKNGQEFLAENAKKKDVITTKSGLQYQIIKPGTGETPKATDTVVTHYKGTLLNGTEFDSSYQRNEPAEFPVGGVIKGWTEALQLMKVGAKWKLFIPSELAYGERGSGGSIPANSTLVFEIELLEVK